MAWVAGEGRASPGGSVARAREAKESMIRLIHLARESAGRVRCGCFCIVVSSYDDKARIWLTCERISGNQ